MGLGALLGGLAVLALFVWIELRVENPLFALSLFRIRVYSFGNIANLMASLGRGGLGGSLGALPPEQANFLTGHSFFPSLVTQPFADGLHVAFWFAIVASLIAAAASWFGRPRKVGMTEPAVVKPAPVTS